MKLKAALATFVVALALATTVGVRDATALVQQLVDEACPNGSSSRGKFVGPATETRLSPPATFTGQVEMELTACNQSSGVTVATFTFIFGTTSTTTGVTFNNSLGNPAPFDLAQQFTYTVGPVQKTVNIPMSGGQYTFNPLKISVNFSGMDGGGGFTLDWIGTFIASGDNIVSGDSSTSAAVQGFAFEEFLRFTQVINPSQFLSAYDGNTRLGDAGEVQFMRAGRGVAARGQAAGDGFFGHPWGMWASYQRSDFENDFAATAFDADTNMVFIGADFAPRDDFIAGVAFGYEDTDVDSSFNRGGQEIDGFSIIPYMGGLVDIGLLELGLDASLGYSHLDVDQFRRATATGALVTSETDSTRWFFSGNANVGKTYGDWTLGGRVGFLVARDELDGFTESDGTVVAESTSDLGRLTVGGDLSWFWESFEPYLSALYEYDYERQTVVTATAPQPANDDDDFVFGLGIRWYSEEGVTAGFEYNSVFGRSDFSSDSYSFQLRADF